MQIDLDNIQLSQVYIKNLNGFTAFNEGLTRILGKEVSLVELQNQIKFYLMINELITVL